MSTQTDLVDQHIGKITKKYIIDMLNALIFSNTVLFDGDDQYNQLPIFDFANEEGYRVEQRGALFVNGKSGKALRLLVVVTESTVQRVCYRLVGLKEAIRLDERKQLYYPLDGAVIDLSIADLNIGIKDATSYSFFDNTNEHGTVSNLRLFAIVKHLLNSVFITLDNKDHFHDLINDQRSLPPIASDPHYKPVFGATHATDSWD